MLTLRGILSLSTLVADCAISAILDHIWNSELAVKILFGVQLIFHFLSLMLTLSMIWPLYKNPESTQVFSHKMVRRILIHWVIRFIVIISSRLPRIAFISDESYWEENGLHFLVFLQHGMTAWFYSELMRLNVAVGRSQFTRPKQKAELRA